MTQINTQAQQTLDSLLEKLGAKKLSDSGEKKYKTSLGRKTFSS